MEERTQAGNSHYENRISSKSDSRVRMNEYFAQVYGHSDDVRSILNETKVGAQRRQNYYKIMNNVFSKP